MTLEELKAKVKARAEQMPPGTSLTWTFIDGLLELALWRGGRYAFTTLDVRAVLDSNLDLVAFNVDRMIGVLS